jgi:HD-GYP domain-containing protein (c-di-GMP phosphodiesterase class II)
VDVYDALSSDRPYRAAFSEARIIAYLTENAGAHFDPRVLEAFFAIIGHPGS